MADNRLTTIHPVMIAISDTLACLAQHYPSSQSMPAEVADMAAHCSRAGPAWPAVLTNAGSGVDRRGAVLSGPIFTSASYPWPRDGQERWLEPVLQVNLVELAGLKGLELGSGWLQLWMGDDTGTLRIVPPDEVREAALASVPSSSAAHYCARLRPRTASDAPAWLTDGHAIARFAEPFIDFGHNELLGYVERILEDPPVGPGHELLQCLLKLREAIVIDGFSYALPHRAFGMINESDLSACAAPPALFVLDEDEPLRHSPDANDGVYVCYEHMPAGEVFSIRGWNLRS